MTVEEIPMVIGAETIGRFSPHHAALHSGAVSGQMIGILMLVGLMVAVFVIVDLVLGGRFRNSALALSTMLAALAPLLALAAAAYDTADHFINLLTLPAEAATMAGVILPALAAPAVCLFVGAVTGAIGVVLRTVLKIVPPRGKPSVRGTDSQMDGN